MTSILRHNDPAKGAIEFVDVGGMVTTPLTEELFLGGRTFKEQIEGIKSLSIRDDDIIVCAFPKCGNYIFTLHF